MDKRIIIFISTCTMMIVIAILLYGIKHLTLSPADWIINEQCNHIIQEMEWKTKQPEDNPKKSQLMPSEPGNHGKKEETVKLNHRPMNLESKNDGLGNTSEMPPLRLRPEGNKQAIKGERKEYGEHNTQAMVSEYPYEIWEMGEGIEELKKDAEELLLIARVLRDEGYEEAAMEYEQKAAELEAQANDLEVKAEVSLHESKGEDGQEMETVREDLEDYTTQAMADEYPYEIWEMGEGIEELKKEAGELLLIARVLSDEGYEEAAMEYEQRAAELEAQANDLEVNAEVSLQESKGEEGQGMEENM